MCFRDVYAALGNQGFKGLYKGNFIGIIHTWLSASIKGILNYHVEKKLPGERNTIFERAIST